MSNGDSQSSWISSVDAVCLSVVSGLQTEARLRLLTGEPLATSHDDFHTAMAKGWQGTPNPVPIQFDHAPGGDLLIEPNGYLMSAYATELTYDGGRAVCVYWCDAIGRSDVVYARDGWLVRSFHPPQGPGYGEPQPEEAGLAWEVDHGKSAMTALFERVAGIEVTEDWLLRTPRPTWMVAEPPTTRPRVVRR